MNSYVLSLTTEILILITTVKYVITPLPCISLLLWFCFHSHQKVHVAGSYVQGSPCTRQPSVVQGKIDNGVLCLMATNLYAQTN